MISRPAAYAIRAMTFLAAQPPGKLAGAKEIAAAEHIPIPFLWKILGILAQRRLIRSFDPHRTREVGPDCFGRHWVVRIGAVFAHWPRGEHAVT